MDRFKGKTALVTGGGSGIGKAAALQLGLEGAQVIVTGMDANAGTETAQQIVKGGGRSSYVRTDLSQHDQLVALFDGIERDIGSLDYAFNNAGFGTDDTPIMSAPLASFDAIFAVNVRAVWYSMQRELQLMKGRRGSSIVNTSSVHGLLGLAGHSIYGASKHAVVGMTKSVALEMASEDIRINCICPGPISTPMFNSWADTLPDSNSLFDSIIPMKRVGKAHEASDVALWLFSSASSFVTGQSITVDGGFSVA